MANCHRIALCEAVDSGVRSRLDWSLFQFGALHECKTSLDPGSIELVKLSSFLVFSHQVVSVAAFHASANLSACSASCRTRHRQTLMNGTFASVKSVGNVYICGPLIVKQGTRRFMLCARGTQEQSPLNGTGSTRFSNRPRRR